MPDDVSVNYLLVRGTAWLSFVCYILTLIGWTRRWPATSLRWLWTLGLAIFVIHLCLAFHLVHHWSHQEAWEATRLQGGYGDGVYLNYLVLLVWLLDVLWWWLKPMPYLERSRWVWVPIQGFLFFMWFNAAVIFAKGPLFLAGGLAFLVLGDSYVMSKRRSD